MSGIMRHTAVLSLCASSLVALGCAQDADLKERLKTIRANRAAESMTGNQARLEVALASGATSWCPSSDKASQLKVTLHTGSRTRHSPVIGVAQAPQDVLPHGELAMSISEGGVTPVGALVAPAQPLALAGKPVIVRAHLIRNPEVRAELPLTVVYDCNQVAEFRGRAGRPGGAGTLRGENGERGLNVSVAVGYATSATGQRVALVKVAPSAGAPAYFALAPGRWLGLDVRGGVGGPGINGGLGGDGGDGGKAEIHFDRRFPELREVVRIANAGGEGGRGGEGMANASYDGRAGRAGAPARYLGGEAEKIFKEELEDGLKIVAER